MLQSLSKKLFIAILLGFICAVYFSTAKNYLEQYVAATEIWMPNQALLGGDFLAFYTAGKLAQKDRKLIYDWRAGKDFQDALLANAPATVKRGYLVFAYPPLMAWIFEKLSVLPFKQACTVWLIISACLGLLATLIVLSRLQLTAPTKMLLVAALFAYLPFTIDCLAGGQTSTIAMLIFACVFYFMDKGDDFLAGLALGFGYYKPPLFLVFALLLLLKQRYRVIAGALTSAALLMLLSLWYVGVDGINQYLQHSLRYLYGADLLPGVQLPPQQGIGLLSTLMVNFDQHHISGWISYLALAVLLIASSLKLAKTSAAASVEVGDRNRRSAFALSCSLSLMLSVQLVKYDQSVYFIPLILAAETLVSSQINLRAILGWCALGIMFSAFSFSEMTFGSLSFKGYFLASLVFILFLMVELKTLQFMKPQVPSLRGV